MTPVDYDAPREASDEVDAAVTPEDVSGLHHRRGSRDASAVDQDEAESYELPGAILSHEDLTVEVLPRQADEFSCAGCFLVCHRSRLAAVRDGLAYCSDCAG